MNNYVIIFIDEENGFVTSKEFANTIKETLHKILEKPEEYIESAEYFSWERYFTDLLIKATQGTYLQYSKSKLNEAYLSDKLRNKVIDVNLSSGILY